MRRTSGYVIGVDLGGTNLRSILMDGKARVWGRDSRESLASQGKEATIDQIVSSVRAMLEEAGSMDIPHPSISGVGVGCPGPLNTKEGIVYFAPNLPGWENVPLVRILRDKIQLPIFLENDANAAALGEWWIGAGRDVDDLVLLTLGTGIGGGVIIQGEVLHGAWDTAAEIGHMIIHEGGLLCKCGVRGHLEAYASATAVVARTLAAIKQGRRTILKEWLGGKLDNLSSELIFRAAGEEDELSSEILEETARFLGIGIANLVNLFNPRLVILTGGMIQAGPLLLEPVRKYAREYSLKASIRGVRIVPAKLGADSGTIGAAAAVLKRKGLL